MVEQRKNWIITSQGDTINLDFVAKVQWLGNVPGTSVLNPELKVRISHGISTGAGAVITYEYGSQAEAEADYARIQQAIIDTAAVIDLRNIDPVIDSVTPNTGGTAGGTEVTIAGNHFETGCKILFDGLPGTFVQVISPQEIKVTTPAHAAGAVDVVYRSPLYFSVEDATSVGAYTYA